MAAMDKGGWVTETIQAISKAPQTAATAPALDPSKNAFSAARAIEVAMREN